jgi:hypothetical protein
MAGNQSSPSGFTAIVQGPLVTKDLKPSPGALKVFIDWDNRLTKGLNQLGQLIGEINAATKITGRAEGIGTTVGNVSASGVMQPPGMTSSTTEAQGAVIMPTGATGNLLGTAAIQPVSAFDASGSAAAAQAAAETFATGAANAAQSNAEAYAATQAATAQAAAEAFAANASNIATGTLNTSRLGGLTVVIATAKLTGTGANGTMTFTNGLLTAQTPAT